MARIDWGEQASTDNGIGKGVVYFRGEPGIPWIGLSAFGEDEPDEDRIVRIDGSVVGRTRTSTDGSGYISAFAFPKKIEDMLSGSEPTEDFNMSFVSGTKLHLVYNIRLHPYERTWKYQSAEPFTVDFTTRKIQVPNFPPSSHFVIDLKKAYPNVVSRVEDVVYGNSFLQPLLPRIEDILDLFEEQAILRIYDHGDGRWSAEGPDHIVRMLDDSKFMIDWPSAVYISTNAYKVHSL